MGVLYVARPEGQVLLSRTTTSQNVRDEFSARHYGLPHLRLPSDHFANHDPLLLNLFFPRHIAARVSHHVPIAIHEGLGRFVTKKAEIAVGVIVLRGKFPGLDRSAPRVPKSGDAASGSVGSPCSSTRRDQWLVCQSL